MSRSIQHITCSPNVGLPHQLLDPSPKAFTKNGDNASRMHDNLWLGLLESTVEIIWNCDIALDKCDMAGQLMRRTRGVAI